MTPVAPVSPPARPASARPAVLYRKRLPWLDVSDRAPGPAQVALHGRRLYAACQLAPGAWTALTTVLTEASRVVQLGRFDDSEAARAECEFHAARLAWGRARHAARSAAGR